MIDICVLFTRTIATQINKTNVKMSMQGNTELIFYSS